MLSLPLLYVFQPLFEPAFYALFGGMVVGFVFQGVREALHGGEFVFIVVGVLIPLCRSRYLS